MKTQIVFLAILILIGCSPVLAQQSDTDCDVKKISITEIARSEFPSSSASLVVPPLARECLIKLAKTIHKNDPDREFEFFEATSAELIEFRECAAHEVAAGWYICRYRGSWKGKDPTLFVWRWDLAHAMHGGNDPWSLVDGKWNLIERVEK